VLSILDAWCLREGSNLHASAFPAGFYKLFSCGRGAVYIVDFDVLAYNSLRTMSQVLEDNRKIYDVIFVLCHGVIVEDLYMLLVFLLHRTCRYAEPETWIISQLDYVALDSLLLCCCNCL
jgi:hypothetical protein